MLNWNVVWAVLRRNVQSYFSGVLGYLVIVLFVTVAAFCAFSSKFFANNLANLDQLSSMFPFLLLALVPAITMSTWADERKLGTDEILFTLPASDVEILLGKYLAVISVYSIALAFSLTQLFVLAWIGEPDWGVVCTTYVGYWLAGAALLSAGMFASVLTGSTTIAYVLGATLCAIPVVIGSVAPGNNFIQSLSLSSQLRDFAAGMIPLPSLLYFVAITVLMLYLNMVFISRRHWSRGQRTAMGLQFAVRALALAAGLISLNFMANQSAAYLISRVDMTAEGLYTLSPTTRETIENAAAKDRAVTIQAFLSPEVPQQYVHARKQLVGLLQQYDRMGGNSVDVRFVDVKPSSSEAQEARTLGIEPVRNKSEVGGKVVEQDVFLGVVVTSNVGEVVIPFLGGESSMEYELTRSLATVTSRPERLKVGVLETDAMRIDDPFIREFNSRMVSELEQQYKVINISTARLKELVDQAEQEESKPQDKKSATDDKATAKDKADRDAKDKESEREKNKNVPDVLLVIQASSLTAAAMDDLVKYIQRGKPALILDDPLPFYPFVYYRPEDIGVVNAPRQARPGPESGLRWVSSVEQRELPEGLQNEIFRMQQQLQQMPPQFAQQMMEDFYRRRPDARPAFEPKADRGTAATLLKALGLEWNTGRIVWDLYNPHPEFTPEWPQELLGRQWPKSYGPRENLCLFVTPQNGAEDAFNHTSPISRGLQELLFFYPGSVREIDGADTDFTPLVTAGRDSGLIPWDDLTYENLVTSRSIDQFTGARSETREPQKSPFTGLPLRRLAARPPRKFDDKAHVIAAHVTAKKKQGDQPGLNVVFVADFDFLSQMYFEQEKQLDKPADNVTFLFNAIEVLAGDESFVTLRNRRVQPRRLTSMQSTIDQFRKERAEQQQQAEDGMRAELEKAQTRLDDATKEIGANKELNIFQKLQQTGLTASSEQRRFELKKAALDAQMRQKIEELKGVEQQKIDQLESKIRIAAVVLPPLPALLLGIFVLAIRVTNERQLVVSSRRRD